MSMPADPATVKSVEAALRAKDRDSAVALARQALARGEMHPLLLNLRAFWYESQNKLEAALADLRQATTLAPDDGLIWNAYGLCLARLDQSAAAVQAFRRTTERAPDFAAGWFNLGHASDRINDLVTARIAFERAAAFDPAIPHPVAHLASLAARRGDWDAARSLGDQALRLDPSLVIAERAVIAADIAQKHFADAERQANAVLSRSALAWEDRYFAESLLGDLRHAERRFAEAFNAYVRGGSAAREANAARFVGGGSILGTIDWLTRAFEASSPWRRPAGFEDGGECTRHVFLLGFPRSGTTLLEQALAARPDVVSLEEQEALADAARAFMSGPAGLGPLAMLGEADRRTCADRYWRRVRDFGVDPSGKVFIDKLPFNTLKLPLIAALFPDAKVLFALRDPRDVVLSCLRQKLRVGAYTYELLTPETAARFYAATMRLAMLYADKLPLDMRFVRHEAVVDDFDAELRATCAFLGLDWDPRMHDFANRSASNPAATPSAPQLRDGLSRAGLAQWRNYRDQLAPFLPILAPWVERFGYPTN